jgi:hypothetical protein
MPLLQYPDDPLPDATPEQRQVMARILAEILERAAQPSDPPPPPPTAQTFKQASQVEPAKPDQLPPEV